MGLRILVMDGLHQKQLGGTLLLRTLAVTSEGERRAPLSSDQEFEKIYQSLTPGLVVAACSAKSVKTLRSFCFSLKGAAIRRGSDAIIFNGSAIVWEAIGIQIDEHAPRGIRVFLVNRFEDPSPASVCARLAQMRMFDALDGSIHSAIAPTLQQVALASNVTILVTTVAEKEGQIRNRRIARWNGTEQGVFIALEHDRFLDDWYSATVTTGATEERYMLDFIYECPQPPEAQPQPESVADPDKPTADPPAMPRPSWLRRLLG